MRAGHSPAPSRSALSRSILAFLLFLACLAAAPPAGAAGPFDRDRIHADYEGGDFDRVIRALEGFRDSGKPCARPDSLFMEKHLGVVYAANPATRERGRYHFLRMLAIDPGADLLDMFVGDEVDGIFGKVRREFALTEAAMLRPAAAKQAAVRSAPPPVTRVARAARASRAAPAARTAPAAPGKPRMAAASGAAGPLQEPPRKTPQKTPQKTPGPTPGLDDWSLGSSPAPAIPPPASPAPASAASAASAASSSASRAATVHAAPDSAARPAWRDPGFWIGGGAAAAVIGFTLYFAGRGSDDPAPRERIYHVPARPAP